MASGNRFTFKLHQFISSALPLTTTEETIQEQPAAATAAKAKAKAERLEPLPAPASRSNNDEGKQMKREKGGNDVTKSSSSCNNSNQQHKEGTPAREPELVDEIPQRTIVVLPKGAIVSKTKAGALATSSTGYAHENDWELLSERGSFCSSNNAEAIFVARAGSVRSIASLEHDNSSNTTLSVPYKIQRTNSSSTIDSHDNVLGPSGKGVLGVDYVEHIVLPTDTVQGICIAYKVSASSLRRANHFTGHSLHSAPKKLLIPLSKQALRTGFIRVQDTDTKEYKLHYFQAEHPDLSMGEAKVYLELADWELKRALHSAKEDKEWDKEMSDVAVTEHSKLRAGQISIKVNVNEGGKPIGFRMRGVGNNDAASRQKMDPPAGESVVKPPLHATAGAASKKPVVHAKPPAIATKSVLAADIYNAALEDQSYGVELKAIQRQK